MAVRWSRYVMIVLLFSIVTVTAGYARDVTLQWNANTESTLGGYKVYYNADTAGPPFNGTGSGQGASPVNVQRQTSATLTGLDPNRSYYFSVTAYDTAGIESGYSNVVKVSEAVPPSVSIASPKNNATVSGTASISINASDNVGVTKVELYLDGILNGTDTATPYLFSINASQLSIGTHTLLAKAYDAAGNSGQSSPVTISVVADTVAPTVSITAPLSNATVLGSTTVQATAADNVGVAKVEFYLNGSVFASYGTAPYSTSWNTTSVANGVYTLTAKAYDASGNATVSAPVSVTVKNPVADTTPPAVASFSLPATSTSRTVPILTFSGSDNVAVTGYCVTSTNATTYCDWLSTPNTSFTFGSTGVKTAYAWVKDAAGNVSASKSATVTIGAADTTAPTVTAFSLPASSTSLTVAIGSFTATDNVAVTGYLLTESATPPAATASGWSAGAPVSYTFASSGSKTLYAWAKDAAGNISAAKIAAVVVSLPDTVAPTASLLAPAAGATVSGTVSVQMAASDNVAVTRIELYQNGTLYAALSSTPYTITWNTALSANGSYSLTVKAYDAAGNVGVSAPVTVTVANAVADTTLPTVTAFSFPATSTSQTVPILSFSGSDNVGVTGYCVTSTNATTYCDWLSTPNTSFTFGSTGVKTAYAWVRDAAGNVSASKSSTVTIGAADTTAPTVTAFSLPASSTSLTVAIGSFTATDNVAVTGYLLTESATPPAATASGWSAGAPISYTFASSGSKTLYAWAKDASGNVSAAKSATIQITQGVRSTIWQATATPAVIDAGADRSVELGLKFKSDVNGFITGIRFYKAATNTGTHTAHLWNTGGTLLASAVFTGESASGWQEVTFASPVAITANTVYVASYHTDGGHYSYNDNYFTNGIDTPPLHALANGVSGPNSVYAYGTSAIFPGSNSYNMNYWVDVVFTQ